MAFICEKFAEAIKKDVPSSKIWTQLETMYNLEALNENESLPFPNETQDFTLPDSDFGTLKRKREEQDEKKSQKGRETPKNLKEIKKDDTKTPTNTRNTKNDTPRRDSKDNKDVGKETKATMVKKEVKKDPEPKSKAVKGRNSVAAAKEENKKNNKREESPRPAKRPTRGSLKPDETNGGKASPLTALAPATKRRRI